MEFLVTLAPIALILGACVGMHFLMMRGMHGAGHESTRSMHSDEARAGDGSAERLRQLEAEVASLREQIAASGRGTNGNVTAATSERSKT